MYLYRKTKSSVNSQQEIY